MLFRRQRVSTVLTYGHNSFNFKLRSSTDVISILLINSIRTANLRLYQALIGILSGVFHIPFSGLADCGESDFTLFDFCV